MVARRRSPPFRMRGIAIPIDYQVLTSLTVSLEIIVRKVSTDTYSNTAHTIVANKTGQQCLLLTNTLSRYHITPTQTKPPGHEERNGMEGVVILVFRVVIAK